MNFSREVDFLGGQVVCSCDVLAVDERFLGGRVDVP